MGIFFGEEASLGGEGGDKLYVKWEWGKRLCEEYGP